MLENMIKLRKSDERGLAKIDWLKSYHTFSFADYYDPQHMGYGHLRVINEDWIAPGQGFGMHPHRDMEIVTFPISGALEHQDSQGNNSVLRAGQVQRMTAGRGILHSEMNHSKSESVHLLQIWILPERKGLAPGYEEKDVAAAANQNALTLLVSPDAEQGTIKIHQNCKIFFGKLEAGKSLEFKTEVNAKLWAQIIDGALSFNGTSCSAGDGVALEDITSLSCAASANSQFLLFEMR